MPDDHSTPTMLDRLMAGASASDAGLRTVGGPQGTPFQSLEEDLD